MKHHVQEIILKNGARGLVIDAPGSQVMSTQFHFRAGNRFARNKTIQQTPHIMEHMAFGANERFKDSHAYEAEFTKNGAYHNAMTSDNSMIYVAECAHFEWERILDLQKSAISKPRFNQDELEAESGNVKSELAGYMNNASRVLWPRMAQELGEDVLTFEEALKTVDDITLDDIKEHHARTHRSHNMRFVVVGDFNNKHTDLKNMLESWELEPGDRLPIPVDEMHSAPAFLVRRKEASNMTFGWSMVVSRRLSDDESDAMDALNHILTGTLHSRILGAARKRGLVYHVFSDTSAFEHNSSWDIGAQANVDKVDAVITIILKEMKRVLAGEIDDADLDAAKSYALGRHQMNAQTAGQINSWYANRYFFDGKIEDFSSQPEIISSVSKEQVIETAREFFRSNCWTFGAYGNTDKAHVDRLSEKLAQLFK